MGTIRQYVFDGVGVETGLQPGATDPVVDDDLVTKGYADATYLNGELFAPFTIANNQSSAANVTGLLFDKDDHIAFKFFFRCERENDTENFQTVGEIYGVWDVNDATWHLSVSAGVSDLDIIGLAFSVTSGGQVQYQSSNMNATGYSGTIKGYITRIPA